MAKRKGVTKASAADRGGAPRRRATGGRRRKATPRLERGMVQAEGSSSKGGRGWLSNARDTAQSVGRKTAGTAKQWAGDAADAVGAVARGASNVAGKVGEKPWPALLIGAGATWLAVEAVRSQSADRSPARGRRGGRRASDRGIVSGTVSKVAEIGRAAGEQIEEFVRDRPLLAGATTLGVGVAVGMAMPSTRGENALLGNARDAVVRTARNTAKGTLEKVRDVAGSLEEIGPFGGGSTRGRSSR